MSYLLLLFVTVFLLFLYHSHCKHNVQVYICSMCCLYISLIYLCLY